MNLKCFCQQIYRTFLHPYKHLVLTLFSTSLFWGAYNSIQPYLLKMIIDYVSNVNNTGISTAFIITCILFIFLLFIRSCVFRGIDLVRYLLYPTLQKSIIEKMFHQVSGQSYEYFQNRFSGNLSNKVSDMAQGVANILEVITEFGALALTLIFTFILMFTVNSIFSIILGIWLIVFFTLSYFISQKIAKLSYEYALARSSALGMIVDSFTNALNRLIFARETYENERISGQLLSVKDKEKRLYHYIFKLKVMQDLSILIFMSSMLAALLYHFQYGRVSPGDFAFVLTVSMNIFQFMWWVSNQLIRANKEIGRCEQALEIMNTPYKVLNAPDAKPLKVRNGLIDFRDVDFHYPNSSPLFQKKNVRIEPMQKIGLVGFSGSGKTTFVHLILRFYDLQKGQICIDNQDISKVDIKSLRENISFIPQDTTLFHRTIFENIRYGNPTATKQQVIDASKKAYCHDFICELAEGYETKVGERGVKLSGGQRQRISIARAFLKNAPLLILDEATSALDSRTETFIQKSLKKLIHNRTTIVIAHRLSTLLEMERILVFDNGQIIEDDSHNRLLKKRGHYAKLWKMQAGGFLPQKGVF